MSVIPCQKNRNLQRLIREYAEVLKTEAHTLGNHGLDERDFYDSGLFRGVIERVRGQFSSTMREKREFARDVLNYMEDRAASFRTGSLPDKQTGTIISSKCPTVKSR